MKISALPAILVGVSGLLMSPPASASSLIEAAPTAWRMQDYLDSAIVTYYTGASCPDGRLLLTASAPNDTKQRYWSIIMSAKLSQKTVGIYYNVINGECTIESFYLKEG